MSQEQEYQLYRKPLTKQEYFSSWDSEDRTAVFTMGKDEEIYGNYLTKSIIMRRDDFTCQNSDCETPSSELTWHHIKKKKNGGDDKPRNGVIICDTCHKAFHRAKRPLVFDDKDNLPPHIRGHTLWEHDENEFDWKKHKSEMKSLRKELKKRNEIRYISWQKIHILLAWLGW